MPSRAAAVCSSSAAPNAAAPPSPPGSWRWPEGRPPTSWSSPPPAVIPRGRGRGTSPPSPAPARGPAGDIVVIAAASRDPARLETEYVSAFTGLGAGTVRALRVTTRAEAGDPAATAALSTATGVFFTGGDQRRITSVLGGTALDTL